MVVPDVVVLQTVGVGESSHVVAVVNVAPVVEQ